MMAAFKMQNWSFIRAHGTWLEPSKLVAGVSAVYGAEYVERVHGETLPIPAERVLSKQKMERLFRYWARVALLRYAGTCTPSYLYRRSANRGIFTGDMFGLVLS